MYVCMCCVCMYVYIYIYIERERERERGEGGKESERGGMEIGREGEGENMIDMSIRISHSTRLDN